MARRGAAHPGGPARTCSRAHARSWTSKSAVRIFRSQRLHTVNLFSTSFLLLWYRSNATRSVTVGTTAVLSCVRMRLRRRSMSSNASIRVFPSLDKRSTSLSSVRMLSSMRSW